MKKPMLFIFLFSCYSLQAQFTSHLVTSQHDDSNNGLLADFDNDGDLDLAFDDTGIYLLINEDGKGDFGVPKFIASGGSFSKAVDGDNDGDIDIIHFNGRSLYFTENLNGDGSDWDSRELHYFQNTGAYGFFHLEDIDGDGDLDAISAAMTWIENLDGQFSMSEEKELYEVPQDHEVSRNIHPADWDDDGDFDILINVGVKLNRSLLFLLENDGSKNYSPVMIKDTIKNLDGLTFTKVSDVDHDGDLDLVMHGGPNDVVWFEYEEGTFGDFQFIYDYLDFPGEFDLVDINNDGEIDVFWCGHGGKFWMKNLGNFTFNAEPDKIGPTSIDPTIDFAFGDIDGDDDIDIVTFGKTIGSFNQDIRWYENKIPIVNNVNEISKTQLLVYPNPTNDLLIIDPDFDKYQIFSLDGRLAIQTVHNQVDVSKVPSGFYLVIASKAEKIVRTSFYKN